MYSGAPETATEAGWQHVQLRYRGFGGLKGKHQHHGLRFALFDWIRLTLARENMRSHIGTKRNGIGPKKYQGGGLPGAAMQN